MFKLYKEYGGWYFAGYVAQALALAGVLGTAAVGIW